MGSSTSKLQDGDSAPLSFVPRDVDVEVLLSVAKRRRCSGADENERPKKPRSLPDGCDWTALADAEDLPLVFFDRQHCVHKQLTPAAAETLRHLVATRSEQFGSTALQLLVPDIRANHAEHSGKCLGAVKGCFESSHIFTVHHILELTTPWLLEDDSKLGDFDWYIDPARFDLSGASRKGVARTAPQFFKDPDMQLLDALMGMFMERMNDVDCVFENPVTSQKLVVLSGYVSYDKRYGLNCTYRLSMRQKEVLARDPLANCAFHVLVDEHTTSAIARPRSATVIDVFSFDCLGREDAKAARSRKNIILRTVRACYGDGVECNYYVHYANVWESGYNNCILHSAGLLASYIKHFVNPAQKNPAPEFKAVCHRWTERTRKFYVVFRVVTSALKRCDAVLEECPPLYTYDGLTVDFFGDEFDDYIRQSDQPSICCDKLRTAATA